jgi:hypothetical protein
MNRKANIAVSGTLVGCMLVEASAGLTHGKALSEVHLITSAPLVLASSGAAMDYVQHNAVYDWFTPPHYRAKANCGWAD